MEKYENLGVLGEGSYGMVMKCRHKETRQVVAIKKFLETEDDKIVRKIAHREVKMLKQVRHENLINLLEVFRRKRRLYLVFEFVDHTALDELEKHPNGADENYVKKMMWQVLKGIEFCHVNNIIHRDVKPENILISKRGVVKLCDFGFARTIASPGEVYTDYVATRWYRAPELLVGDTNYGRAVDIWAIGCMFSEILTGEPLFPGESDIDQLHLIMKCFGNLIGHHREVFRRNPLFIGMRLPEPRDVETMERKYPQLSAPAMDIIKWALRLDPLERPSCSQLLRHELFTRHGWENKYTTELRYIIEKEFEDNPLLKTLGITVYGSVHEARQREAMEKKVQKEVAESYLEGKKLDHDGKVGKKERKKRVRKDPLLAREKAPKALPLLSQGASKSTDIKLPPASSQTSLTVSQPRIISPQPTNSQTQFALSPIAMSPHSLLPLVQATQTEGLPSNLTSSSTKLYLDRQTAPALKSTSKVDHQSSNPYENRHLPHDSWRNETRVSTQPTPAEPSHLLQYSSNLKPLPKKKPFPPLKEKDFVAFSSPSTTVPFSSKPKKMENRGNQASTRPNLDMISTSPAVTKDLSRSVQQKPSSFNAVK